MATTNTVTEPTTGVLVRSFTALATGDTFDIEAPNAESVLFQVTGGTFGATPAVCALVGSLDGTNFAPLYARNANQTTGVVVPGPVANSAANVLVWDVQPSRFYRVQVTGSGGSGITCTVVIRNKVGV